MIYDQVKIGLVVNYGKKGTLLWLNLYSQLKLHLNFKIEVVYQKGEKNKQASKQKQKQKQKTNKQTNKQKKKKQIKSKQDENKN